MLNIVPCRINTSNSSYVNTLLTRCREKEAEGWVYLFDRALLPCMSMLLALAAVSCIILQRSAGSSGAASPGITFDISILTLFMSDEGQGRSYPTLFNHAPLTVEPKWTNLFSFCCNN